MVTPQNLFFLHTLKSEVSEIFAHFAYPGSRGPSIFLDKSGLFHEDRKASAPRVLIAMLKRTILISMTSF